MAAYAQQQAPEKPDPRKVVELQDALDAVIQLAAVIGEETQADRIPADRGQHAAAMLMLVREYIQPLPRGLDTDGVSDNLTTDLGAIVMACVRPAGPLGTRAGVRSSVAGPGSDFSKVPAPGCKPAALEPVAVPTCPPGPVPAARASVIIWW